MSQRLSLSFSEGEVFHREFVRNIASGGAYVKGACDAKLRTLVEVELDLGFCGETLVLEAEVVHVDAGGAAVQFLTPASELRDRLEPLIEAAGGPGGPGGPAGPPDTGSPSQVALDDFADLDPGAPEGGPCEALDCPADPLEEVRDRRRAARSSAQLTARIEASHLELDGLTRDLSEHGVLISVDGSDVPVGRSVQIELRNPDTGEQLRVEGHVSRHIETEGTVAALAVGFDAVAGEAQQLSRFVADVKRAEQARVADGIRGQIQELGMAKLIQMLGGTSSQGTVTATHAAEQGVVAFEAGQFLMARVGSLRGMKALARMLSWKEGSFEFHASALASEPPHAPDADPIPLETALREAAQWVDELTRVRAPELVPAAHFCLDREILAAEAGLSKTEEAVLDLAGAGFSLRRILDVIPEQDATVLGAIASLLDRGVLVEAEASS